MMLGRWPYLAGLLLCILSLSTCSGSKAGTANDAATGTNTETSTDTGTSTGDGGCGLGAYAFPTGPAYSTKAGTKTLSRITTWAPGIAGGVPERSQICATLSPAKSGSDDVAINAAIASCAANGVVKLNPGTYKIATAIQLNKSDVVLRGSGGPGAGATVQTRLVGAAELYGPVVNIGADLFPHTNDTSADCTADALQGTTSVTVKSTSGFAVGDLVVIDMTTDKANDTGAWIVAAPAGGTGLAYPYAEYNPTGSPPGRDSRGWFSRMNRPLSQVMEIVSINGNTLEFSTPFHMTFDLAHAAQVTGFTVPTIANCGLEDLYVSGAPGGGATQYNNVVLSLAKYSWVENVESDQSNGYSIGLDSSFRCVVRDSYMHSTINATPGGAGYGLEFSAGAADNLVENSISWNFNKVMVMRASGGGNVIAYSYLDDGWIEYQPNWPESGLDDGHMAAPHFELFEGNLSFSMGGDDTWGGAIFETWLRNVATGHRSGWPPLNAFAYNSKSDSAGGCTPTGPGDFSCIPYADVGPRVPAGISHGHVYYNFVGNVLGSVAMPVAPQSKGFQYENSAPDWTWDPVSMWWIGFGGGDNAPTDQGAVNSLFRDGNYDYATNSVHWNKEAQTLPSSLYLCSKPAFFGGYTWPWADGSNATTPYVTHPFQYFPFSNLGAYATSGAQVTHAGYQLPAYVRFLQLHGIETPPSSCATATPASAPAACKLLLTGAAP